MRLRDCLDSISLGFAPERQPLSGAVLTYNGPRCISEGYASPWSCSRSAACYEPPSDPCAIACTTQCPDGLSCQHGFCVSHDDTCDLGFTHVTTGAGFACGLDDRQALWCWGANDHHQISAQDQLAFPFATRRTGRRWDSIDAGGGHICGISEGALYCWGRNDWSQVSPEAGDVSEPFAIVIPGGPTTWSAVSTGPQATCAIGGGTPYCWGRNQSGSLGVGASAAVDTPTKANTALTDFIAIDVGSDHSCAISSSAGVLCAGNAAWGAIGPNANGMSSTSFVVAMAESSRSIATSENASCAVRTDGSLWCWGDNRFGELGMDDQVTISDVPVRATLVDHWLAVSGDYQHFCGLAGTDPNDAAVYCWGSERQGGIGDGFWEASRRWAKVIDSGAQAVATGWALDINEHSTDRRLLEGSCALVGRDIKCWGDNRFGQLGRGTTTMAVTPTEVAGDHHFSRLAVGDHHACGVDGDDLYCWGSAVDGAVSAVSVGASMPCTRVECDIGQPEPQRFISNVDEVATGAKHTCSLSAGRLTCWGANDDLQLGTFGPGGVTPRDVEPPFGQVWSHLFQVGGNGQCAAPVADETHCWGNVFSPGLPMRMTVLDRMEQILSSPRLLCARTGTTLSCGGEFSLGQIGTPFGGGCNDGFCGPDETAASCVECNAGMVALPAPSASFAMDPEGHVLCGVRPDQNIACWGSSPRGQTGRFFDDNRAVDPTYTPNVLSGVERCTTVTIGAAHACAICDGAIHCWGDNQFGQIGSGEIGSDIVRAPRRLDLVLDGDPWIDLRAGRDFTCTRSQSGRTFCWGYGAHGALGNGGVAANLPGAAVLSAAP